jgi:hypothetical protein
MLAPKGVAQFWMCGVIVMAGGVDANDVKDVKVACQRE